MIDINLSDMMEFVSGIKEISFSEVSDFFCHICKIENLDLELVRIITTDEDG